ncbi:MAG: HD domain-containing protein [Chloroflexota bacterium]|nr:MAG: HD domain-containing protein [Chloroflexota bacterium]
MAPEWRPAVRQAMREAAEAENGAADRFNYRLEHVRAVVTLAKKLARLTGADEEIAEAAAWLHDVSKRDGEEHAQTGAAFAAEFLAQTDFPPDKIPAVVRAIAEHQGLWRDEPLANLESMVLWDADKLSKLGLTAVIHFTGMILAGDASLTTEQLLDDLQSVDWQRRAVESMHTEPARRAAATRLAAYERFVVQLEQELLGHDLETE